MKKIFISPENRGAPHGKYAVTPARYEKDVCYAIAAELSSLLSANGFQVEVAPYSSSMADRVQFANNTGVDYYICLHTNAGGGTGTECLCYSHPLSIKANQLVYDELVKLYPSKRGLKDYSEFYENQHTNMVSCYPEIAFHDNPKDVEFILGNIKEIAIAICKGICAYFDVPFQIEPDEDKYEELYAEIKLREQQVQEVLESKQRVLREIRDLIEKEMR